LVIDGIGRAFENGETKRVCIQALNYPRVFDDLVALVTAIRSHARIPVSVSCQPLTRDNVVQLAHTGIERIGIPLDASSEGIFTSIKGASAGGPYDWKKQWQSLGEAVCVLGRGKVSTHFIVGLGETERQMVEAIQRCIDMGVLPGLFAFTPILGTSLAGKSQPSLAKYRRIQVARYLILHGLARCDEMSFDDKGDLSDFGVDDQTLLHIVEEGEAFQTSGCPDCNRPYYNEKPTGPLYNYPYRLNANDVRDAQKQLGLIK
jgi:biotin synthase